MANNYVQPGQVLDYTNAGSAAIPSGALVAIGGLVGVALTAIPVGAVGTVGLEGVWRVPKKAGTAITQGAPVVFDVSDGAFTVGTPATGDISGAAWAWEAAASADTTMLIKLSGAPGTVKAA